MALKYKNVEAQAAAEAEYKADLINDEQLGSGQVFHFPVEFVFGQGHGQLPGHVDGGGEVDAVAPQEAPV